jgi:hypothetical protein
MEIWTLSSATILLQLIVQVQPAASKLQAATHIKTKTIFLLKKKE